MKKFITLMLLCVLPACGPAVGPATEATDDPGRFPTEYKSLAKNALRESLKDPDSMKDFAVGTPRPIKAFNGLLFGGGYTSFYRICMAANAKNGFGGYTGIEAFHIDYKNGQVGPVSKGCYYDY